MISYECKNLKIKTIWRSLLDLFVYVPLVHYWASLQFIRRITIIARSFSFKLKLTFIWLNLSYTIVWNGKITNLKPPNQSKRMTLWPTNAKQRQVYLTVAEAHSQVTIDKTRTYEMTSLSFWVNLRDLAWESRSLTWHPHDLQFLLWQQQK